MKIKKSSFLILSLLVFGGCATIFQGGPDKIPVKTNPEGAKVLLNGSAVCNTPCTVEIPHNRDSNIKIEKRGYESIQLERGKVLSGWFIADLLWLVGGVIDLATSNQGHYPDDPIDITLQKAENQ